MRKYFTFFNVLFVLIFVSSFLLMIFSAKMDSQTTDEGIHIFSGYTYLKERDFRLDPEHPPLLKEISALPIILIKDIHYSLDSRWTKAGNFYYDSWQEARTLGEDFLYNFGNNAQNLIFWGRFPMIILTVILGVFGFFWAKKNYGSKAGIFALFLILFFPNILAHGHLINTDLGLTLFFFMSIYFWGKFLKKPNWKNNIFAGLFSGLALASKFTAVILLPILVILIFAKFFADKSFRNWQKFIIGFFGVLIMAFIIVWASYGFTSPAEFYKGFILVSRHALVGHSSFLWGMFSITGWWYYFPIAILFKTPIPIFVFLFLSIFFWRKIRAKNIFDEYLLIIPPIIFLAVAIYSKADLGIRHILPIFPFLFVFISKSINLIDFSKIKNIFKKSKKAWATVGFLALILWYLASATISFPNYLAYFNELAGGPKGGYKILTDSNLDWGQDIFRIKDYLDKNNIQQVWLVYPWDGEAALNYYQIKFIPLKPDDYHIKGKVLISATYYQTDAYKWLRGHPFEQITPGVFIFDVNQ